MSAGFRGHRLGPGPLAGFRKPLTPLWHVPLITLMFVPKRADATVLVRGAYFRICADGTLRGPDNAISATYADGLWELGHRRYTAFECKGPVHLRVTDANTRRENLGPYDFVKGG